MDFTNPTAIQNIIIYLTCGLVNTIVLMYSSGKFFLALQQLGYNGKAYMKWTWSWKNPYIPRLTLLVLLGVMFSCVLNITFSPLIPEEYSGFAGFFAYLVFVFTFINTESHTNAKLPLKMTRRLVRLTVTTCLIFYAATVAIMYGADAFAKSIEDQSVFSLRYSIVCITPILAPLFIYVAHLMNSPFEIINKRRYIRRTKAQLASSSVIKIGITGSYGKTSVKNILTTILSQRYRVLSTPQSYNTPMGISLSVKKLDSTHDVFIAEMGARRKGDISDLASIVKPQYAVLTGVNTQHLSTFLTEENIKQTKFELFESLGEDGKGFFSADNVGSIELYEKFKGKKFKSGLNGEGNLVTVTDEKFENGQVTFNLVIKGEKPVRCQTNLLGKHNLSNICLASSVAYEMGLTPSEISSGINRLVAINHRLELIPNNKNIIIIDDSYNSNEDGVNAALEVLSTFDGRKIVMTPGLVELGARENIANFEFGKKLAKYADIVFVIGKHNAEMLISGLLEGGFKKENIVFAKNGQKGNNKLNGILSAGDVVLFENDLPDTYD